MHGLYPFSKKILPLSIFLFFITSLSAQDAFITSWQTDHFGVSNSTSITIPVNPAKEYAFDVDWDNDGQYDELQVSTSISHDFGTPGSYTIRIRGHFPQLFFDNGGDREKLLDVVQWGSIEWQTMNAAFKGCKHLNISATDAPDLSQVTNFTNIFSGCSSFNSSIGHWDVSQVNSFYFAFHNCILFNQPLNEWNTSNATNMQRMFIGCTNFNQPLDNWEVGKVTNFGAMFNNCKAFNQALASWDVSSAKHLSLMFAGASAFNQDIGNWQLDNLTHMHTMFNGASAFNQDIGDWNVSQVTSLASVFKNASSFNQDISRWEVGKVTNLAWAFAGASSFNQDIGDWEVSNVDNLAYTFFHAKSFNQDISQWEVGKVTSFAHTFDNALAFNQDIGNWEVSQVTNFGSALSKTLSFDQDLSNWDVSQATKMSNMFHQTGLSTENYDRLLMAWAELALQDSVHFDAGNSIYCEGWEARAQIMANFGWDIDDGGADNTPPVPLCQDITIELDNSQKRILPSQLDNGSYGHCSELLFSATKTEFGCEDIGSYTNTLTMTDQLGNVSTCHSTITIVDGAIQFECPDNKTVLPNRPGCQSIVNWEELYGNCSTEVTSTHRSGFLFPTGTTPITYTATNHLHDTTICRFTITVASDLSYEVTVQDPSCFRSADGFILVDAQGGAGNYLYDWDIDGLGDQNDPAQLEGLNGGAYQIILSDGLACSSSAHFQLDTPTALSLQSTIIENMDGNIIDLSVGGGQPNYQYDWSHDGTGDFDDPQDLEVTTGGSYTVVVRDENGCEASHTAEVLLSNTYSPFTLLYFDLFPNPNQGIFDIQLANHANQSTIAIFDLQGKKVYSQTITGRQAQLNVAQLPEGNYFLRVNNSMGTLIKSFVINSPIR